VSSILPFVIVTVVMAVIASMALGAAAQPATDADEVRRDPWRERIRPIGDWCVRSARDVRSWLVAGLGAIRQWWHERRARRAATRAERQTRKAQQAEEKERRAREAAASDRAEKSAGTQAPAPVLRARPEPPRPDGAVTTALRVTPDVAVVETVGDEVATTRPGIFVRLRSGVGLVALISMIGLAVAAALAAAAAAIGAALDGFVN
jgi:hypothetical protein